MFSTAIIIIYYVFYSDKKIFKTKVHKRRSIEDAVAKVRSFTILFLLFKTQTKLFSSKSRFQMKILISGENDGADWSESGSENTTSQKSTSAAWSRKDRRRKNRETRTNHWTNWEKEEKLAVTEENNQERNSPQSKGSFLTSKNSMVQEQIVHHLGLNNNFVKRSF